MFKYIFIPANDGQKIDETSASKDGGLENDALRKRAEDFFQESLESIDSEAQKRATADALVQQGMEAAKISEIMATIGAGRMGSNVEIITVCIANEANKFVGVSMYSDGHISFKPSASLNKRATKLLRDCGHDTDVKGDVFIGRAFDDEREDWMRLDFQSSDIKDDALWIKNTQTANAGRNMDAYRSSGAMKKMLQPNQGAVEEEQPVPLDEGYLSWSQTSDEVEVRFALPVECNSKSLVVTISSSSLKISSNTINFLKDVGPQFQAPEGAPYFGKIVKDDSMWSISTEDSIKVLCVTLAKSDNSTWKHLLS